ncbi:MAG: hypothetical protein JWM86_512 [Thermoleophilia bacterium]|nr:hypothetical protein [Thermoleophilia bacterium]
MTDSSRFSDDFDEFDNLLDDDDDVVAGGTATATRPMRATAAPRAAKAKAPKAPRVAGSRPSIRITPDWNRVAAVLFIAAVVVFILYFAVSSIMGARREGAYKNYFGEVRTIAATSTAQGDELETILDSPDTGTAAQRIANIEDLAARAEKLEREAKALEAPEQLAGADRWLVTSLEYRANGLQAVQRALSASIESKDQEASATAVAIAMTRLVASDVTWADSFAADSRAVLKGDEVDGVSVADSVFVSNLEALSPKGIESMLDRIKSSSAKTETGAAAAAPKDGKVRGGQLEAGRVTVAPSGQTLAPGALTEIKGGDDISFEVPFTNQGEVQLTEVPVKITLRGEESDTMELTGVIDVVDPGQTGTAKIALDEIPNFGEVLEVDILVGPIPGEKTADNNRGSFQLQFSL